MANVFSLDAYITPTTVTDTYGIWHPAIRHGLRTFYYHKERFITEDAAAECAKGMVEQVTKEVNDSLGVGHGVLKELGKEETTL